MALLEVENLEVFYGKSRVVDGVSFDVEAGELVSLVGANGAGKTSVLDSLFNYTDWRGSIRFRGESLANKDPYEVANAGLSYCMESGNIFPHMTVRENLLSGAHRNRDEVEEQLDRVYDVFPKLKKRLDQRAKTLSGGERKMVAIGKSLMSEPDLLILDEPTLGLAPVIIEEIADAIDHLRERNFAVLLVEQNVTFGFEHANEVVVMKTGEFVARGSPDELRHDEGIQKAYLGAPSTDAVR